MKSVFRLSVGLLLAASVVGCNTCQQSCNPCQPSCNPCHQSCFHKVFGKLGRGRCCQDAQWGDGCGQAFASGDCGHAPSSQLNTWNSSYAPSAGAMVHGYGNSVVYTGDDCRGNPQPMVGQMRMSGSGCSGCGGGNVASQSAPGGCTSGSSGAHNAPKTTPNISGSGGCAGCAAGATFDSFYNPIEPHHLSPAPAPPAEAIPGVPNETSPGDRSASQTENIRKINWVPRQL